MTNVIVEVVCCTVDECVAAEQAGADRIELCSVIEVGGVTPSVGLVEQAMAHCRLPMAAMLRPRAGDFAYSSGELETMRKDAVRFASMGVEGLVLGCLRGDHGALVVDVDACRTVLDGASGPAWVLHRAIDITADPVRAARIVADIGFSRVLASGGEGTPSERVAALERLVRSGVQVVAGGGVRPENVAEFVGAGVRQVHFAAFRGEGKERLENGVRMIRSIVGIVGR